MGCGGGVVSGVLPSVGMHLHDPFWTVSWCAWGAILSVFVPRGPLPQLRRLPAAASLLLHCSVTFVINNNNSNSINDNNINDNVPTWGGEACLHFPLATARIKGQCSRFRVQGGTSRGDIGHFCTLNPEPWILNPQPSTLNPQPSILNPRPSTLNPQPSTLNPEP